MKTIVLLVTWIVSGQPPTSYQARFGSEEACTEARDAVLADGRRLKAEHERVQIAAARASNVDPALFLAGNRAPQVTAVCAAGAAP
jgi:hypothetical protein